MDLFVERGGVAQMVERLLCIYPSLASVVSWGRLKLAKTLSAPILCIAIDNIRFFIHKRLLLIYLGFLGPSKPCVSLVIVSGQILKGDRGTKYHKYGMSGSCWQKSINHSAKLMINFRST